MSESLASLDAPTLAVFVLMAIIVLFMVGYLFGRWFLRLSHDTPRKVRRALAELDTDAAQVHITFKGRHTDLLIDEVGRRGFTLHDRSGDLLIFRKIGVFQ